MKREASIWFYVIFCWLFVIPSAFGQIDKLSTVSRLADQGNDSTLVLLAQLDKEINFKDTNDVAFEYLLIKSRYYWTTAEKAMCQTILNECKPYYSKSTNDRLKIWYDVSRIEFRSLDLEQLEDNVRAWLAKAVEIDHPKSIVSCNLLMFRIFRKKLIQDSIDYYINKSESLAKKHKVDYYAAHVSRMKGGLARRNSEFIKAIKYYDESIEFSGQKGFELHKAKVILLKAKVYQERGLYSDAYRTFQDALRIYKKRKISARVGEIYLNIGRIHQVLGNHEDAIEQFILANNLLSKELFPFVVSRLLTHLGNSYLAIGDVEKAKKYLDESIAMKEEIDDLFTLPLSFNILGELYLNQNETRKSKAQFYKTIALCKDRKSKSNLENAYMGLARIALIEEDFASAETNARLSLDYAKLNETINAEYSALSLLADLAAGKGDYQNAIQYYQVSRSIRDSVINFQDALKFGGIVADHKNQKNEIEVLKVEQVNQQNDAVIQQNRLRSKLYQFGVISGLIILGLFLRSFVQSKRAAKKQKKLNTQLNESNKKLIESNDQLEQFAFRASHDLKTPLITIVSFLSLLEKTAREKLTPKEMDFIDIIAKNGKDLTEMIDDILEYAKVGAQTLTIQEIDMKTVINETCASLQSSAEEHVVELTLSGRFPVVKADTVKIKRVFQNIISNAIKFHDPNKTNRSVQIDYQELEEYHQFSIADNGIGISETNKNIFDPFTHLNSKEDYDGTGIGLAMSKKIVEKHGGKLWYESNNNDGTIFYMTIKKTL